MLDRVCQQVLKFARFIPAKPQTGLVIALAIDLRPAQCI
jgi:hypothetical protein